ncbi:MAG: DUF2231 domain-containing protein, partial [Roseiflexaceae bacterium]|nr:DUF2231 domain-containing protein [Roseiflexaceae bacterium]
MESRAKLMGHAIHPLLVMFPAALLLSAVVFDLLRLLTGTKKWSELAYWNTVGGIGGGAIAAVPGLIDWWHLPDESRAKRVGLIHAIANFSGMALFVASLLLRRSDKAEPTAAALGCAIAGASAIRLGGYLGGELVERLGVGVTPGANVNAPPSLTQPNWRA